MSLDDGGGTVLLLFRFRLDLRILTPCAIVMQAIDERLVYLMV